MKKVLRLLLFSAVGMLCCFSGSEKAQAYMSFLDGDLEINGIYKEQMYIRTHIPRNEEFHKTNIDFWRSSLIVEGLYKLKKEGDWTVNLFGGFRYFYEKAPAIDSEKKRGMSHKTYSEYTHPRDDDLITELYVDFQSGPWQFKLGKQIVVWGETNIKQTADIINPIDLRHGSPGTENWEEIKIGLYMLRGLYQTDLPGQLNFEFLFIPGDFEPARIPNEGTYQGAKRYESSANPERAFGISEWGMEKARHDAPGWNISNWEAGFKLRGFTWNIDWSVFYFNTLDDSPKSNGNNGAYGLVYVKELIRSGRTGVFDPKMPDYKVYNYKRYEVIGATFQTRFEKFPISEWRLESFYYVGQPLNKGTDAKKSSAYKITRRDTFGFGIDARDRYTLPYVTHNWFDDRKMSFGLTFFYEKVFNHDGDLILRSGRGHRPGDSHSFEVVWSIQQFFNHSKWMIMFTGSYNPIGKAFLLPVLSYAPGRHWRFEGGVPIYTSSASRNRVTNSKDSVLLRVRYEF
ncbi:MAG: DUF1302 domain-containing protein [Deltaproteobacteria bacterium]|nr:DUF1302 domain-containing protein [Deltaproteobacteria bacterium]